MKSIRTNPVRPNPVYFGNPILILGAAAFLVAPFAGLLWRTREWFGW